ncbi:uncharacterized protein TRUGW13939_05157 [Talaromyces rugulosus]|uniref:glutathione transferase n=1 Tax=Talaromyces rugulosus TaxID=121627 RepID=A0A7H8QVN7_TALRU|nr:uncharacterized protein TRUGW13939_05157 [Talaromyces rugulosus]QKX58037.1 hypothetical protein TRUGW13939_05157 [Talaromyces rugulosus]
MPLKIYGMAQSSCTRRVLVTLAEKNITDYELIIVNLPLGEQYKPSYTEKAPFGKVPLLDDNGFLLYESRAICQGRLGGIRIACSIEINFFDVPIYALVWEKLIKQRAQLGEPDEALAKKNLDLLDTNLAVYEKILSKQKYLAGDEITLADLYHLPYGVEAWEVGLRDVVNKYPHVTRWFESIESRSSWERVLIESSL